ncbi:head-tail adaptor protein [Bartonella tamiae]|uniref:Phage head-tail adaptor n=1 Tax=Bartonella tamiae Th239 TaxID=1094558 RepID=J0ZSD4_9HYPH|nr:head-tail adaptor protein [Bartonella tamiae]EJF91678.1 hypothetical protein ME5_00057 [Bartonella tamiae Th239]
MRLHEDFGFFKREKIDDGMGNFYGKWVMKFRTKAAITYRQGSETVQASRLEGKQPAFLSIRRFSSAEDITTDWCCCNMRDTEFDQKTGNFKGAVYNIRAINLEPSNRQYYRLTLEGGVAIG